MNKETLGDIVVGLFGIIVICLFYILIRTILFTPCSEFTINEYLKGDVVVRCENYEVEAIEKLR